MNSMRYLVTVFSSLCLMYIEWIAASILASCLAPTCSVLVHLVTSSFRTETILLFAILRKTSPTQMGQGPGFFSSDIKWQDWKVSIAWVSTRSVPSFWTTFTNLLWRSLLDVQNFWKFEFGIYHKLFPSIPEEAEPPLGLISAFLFIPLLIDCNLAGWIISKGAFSNTSCEAVLKLCMFLDQFGKCILG